jgi:cobalamin biosynthetic protein CobC
LTVAGGTDLFTLVAAPDAAALHAGLARLGIWTRAFAGLPGRLRLGLPGSDQEFERLERALAALRTPSATRE